MEPQQQLAEARSPWQIRISRKDAVPSYWVDTLSDSLPTYASDSFWNRLYHFVLQSVLTWALIPTLPPPRTLRSEAWYCMIFHLLRVPFCPHCLSFVMCAAWTDHKGAVPDSRGKLREDERSPA